MSDADQTDRGEAMLDQLRLMCVEAHADKPCIRWAHDEIARLRGEVERLELSSTRFDGSFSHETKPCHTCASTWWYWYKLRPGEQPAVAAVRRDPHARDGYFVYWPPESEHSDRPVDLFFTNVLWGPPVGMFDGETERDQRHRIAEQDQSIARLTRERDAARAEVAEQQGHIHSLARERDELWVKHQEAIDKARAALADNALSQSHGGKGITKGYYHAVDKELSAARAKQPVDDRQMRASNPAALTDPDPTGGDDDQRG